MNSIAETNQIVPIAITIKTCPFCANRGLVTQVADQARFGVRCCGCQAAFPETYDAPDSAIAAWCQRQGTASSAGGRGTRGKCSWRKRRSCRKNLRLARKRKKLEWIRDRVDTIIPWLKAYRAVERAEREAARAENWAWLKEREPQIMANPMLRKLYESLPSRIASAGAEKLDGQNHSSGVNNHAGNPP
jgi:hypothetical protein